MSAPRLLAGRCLACNREPGEPMCDLCRKLEEAEARATDNERRDDE